MKRIVRHHLDFAISYNKADEKHTLLAGGYRYLDHVTDAYIEAYGESMEEAFSFAAKGTVNVMFELKISKLGSKYKMTGYAMTESVDISKHGYKTEIKGITYHEMEILQESGLNKVRFILDL
jgi:SHS2 domain-containing protein